nr:hypothetical protein [Tanacetum cinerariifolium]
MSIQLDDQSIKYPIGVCANFLIKVNKFIFLVDFIVLEIDEDELVLIILGRPFLATTRAVIDVYEGKLSLRVRNEIVTFNIRKSMKSKHFRDDYLYYADHTAKIVREQWVDTVVLKKGGMTVVKNEKKELNPQRTVTRWRVCIDYRKLNNANRKDHFPLLFIDQMLERLAGQEYYCFLDEFSGYIQIPIAPKDQEKTTFTYPYRTFAYKRMPFRLCNAPSTFQRCMTAIFYELIEDSMEVFMDDFSVFGSSFDHCLKNIEKMLKRRFIKDFSQVTCPMTQLLVKDAPFNFFEECIQAFDKLKHELTHAQIMIKPDWSLPFEVMCDIESYEGVSQEMRRHKSFDNVTAAHQEGIMVLPQPQEKSSKPASTCQVSFAMHIDWFEVAMPVNVPVASNLGMKHLKSISKSMKYSMFGG